jgi:2-dehydro-3-deoxyphosphogluconate aldolase / (4S)-4-hydroxy-2-oxoglutarate aldolase
LIGNEFMPVSKISIEDVTRRIEEIGIIPVVRASTVEEANRAVEAICAGGIPAVEITMTVPNAVSVIRELAQQRGKDVLIGAGRILHFGGSSVLGESGAVA